MRNLLKVNIIDFVSLLTTCHMSKTSAKFFPGLINIINKLMYVVVFKYDESSASF